VPDARQVRRGDPPLRRYHRPPARRGAGVLPRPRPRRVRHGAAGGYGGDPRRLRQRWPDYQSADGHLLYARALEEIGRTDEAIEEYKALAGYFPGAEARVRYGLLLDRLDRKTEARMVLSDLLTYMRRAPKHVRKVQAEWIGMAEKAMRG
jgi:hypothetical protein